MGYYEPEDDYFEVDENFNFNTGINKLLDQEVEKRVAERVAEYQKALERDEKSQLTIRNLQTEVRKYESDLSKAKQIYKEEGADEKARELLGGFKLGDEVWFVKSNYVREVCETCSGKRKVTAEINGEQMEVDCPKCKGYGHVSNNTQSVEKGIVLELEIHTWAEGRQLDVKMYIKPTSYRDSDNVSKSLGNFYKTEADCKAALKV